MTTIFISHRSTDSDDAAALADWLRQLGYHVSLDVHPTSGIAAGVDWEQWIYARLRTCEALLIVLTPDLLDAPWCLAERAIAREKGKKVFVVRTKPTSSGPIIPALQEVDLTVHRDAGLEKLRIGLLEAGLDPNDSFARDPKRPIYPGLESFDVEDAAIFFGRARESRMALENLHRLRRQPACSPKLLLITGASGSGKSSLMRAGVLARLAKEPHVWIPTPAFRRGLDALASLATTLALSWPQAERADKARQVRAILEKQGLLPIVDQLRLLTGRPDATVVLALDQTEELLATGESSSLLLDILRSALSRSSREIMAIATIRSDQLGLWQAHPAIAEGTTHGPLLFEPFSLGPMPIDRVPELARRPAQLIDLKLDDDLVDAIRAETATPDALPLLAYTLRELHERYSGDNRLTLDEYKALGRLEGAVRTQANDAIKVNQLSPDERDALRAAFVPTMVRATDDGGFAREPALRADIDSRAEPLIARLISARLLKTGRDLHNRPTIEIAHEALLRVWPLLTAWLAEDAQKLTALAALKRAALAWEESGRKPDYLDHRDQRLADLQQLLTEPHYSRRLDLVHRLYLDACQADQSRRTKHRRLLRYGFVGASILFLALAGITSWQWDRAAKERLATSLGVARTEILNRNLRGGLLRLAQEVAVDSSHFTPFGPSPVAAAYSDLLGYWINELVPATALVATAASTEVPIILADGRTYIVESTHNLIAAPTERPVRMLRLSQYAYVLTDGASAAIYFKGSTPNVIRIPAAHDPSMLDAGSFANIGLPDLFWIELTQTYHSTDEDLDDFSRCLAMFSSPDIPLATQMTRLANIGEELKQIHYPDDDYDDDNDPGSVSLKLYWPHKDFPTFTNCEFRTEPRSASLGGGHETALRAGDSSSHNRDLNSELAIANDLRWKLPLNHAAVDVSGLSIPSTKRFDLQGRKFPVEELVAPGTGSSDDCSPVIELFSEIDIERLAEKFDETGWDNGDAVGSYMDYICRPGKQWSKSGIIGRFELDNRSVRWFSAHFNFEYNYVACDLVDHDIKKCRTGAQLPADPEPAESDSHRWVASRNPWDLGPAFYLVDLASVKNVSVTREPVEPVVEVVFAEGRDRLLGLTQRDSMWIYDLDSDGTVGAPTVMDLRSSNGENNQWCIDGVGNRLRALSQDRAIVLLSDCSLVAVDHEFEAVLWRLQLGGRVSESVLMEIFDDDGLIVLAMDSRLLIVHTLTGTPVTSLMDFSEHTPGEGESIVSRLMAPDTSVLPALEDGIVVIVGEKVFARPAPVSAPESERLLDVVRARVTLEGAYGIFE